jgi:hypothetical protein
MGGFAAFRELGFFAGFYSLPAIELAGVEALDGCGLDGSVGFVCGFRFAAVAGEDGLLGVAAVL